MSTGLCICKHTKLCQLSISACTPFEQWDASTGTFHLLQCTTTTTTVIGEATGLLNTPDHLLFSEMETFTQSNSYTIQARRLEHSNILGHYWGCLCVFLQVYTREHMHYVYITPFTRVWMGP